jgi:hypothetical protein
LRPKAKKEGRHDPEKRALMQVPGTAPPVQLVYRDGNLFP